MRAKRRKVVAAAVGPEELRALRQAAKYVRSMTGARCSRAEALRFLIRNWEPK